MNFKNLVSAFVVVVSITTGGGAHAQAATTAASSKVTRVVFQVSDVDSAKWNLTLNNASNVQRELGESHTQIEIVAYGPGIGMLKADALTSDRVSEAVKAGVRIVACENTMKSLKLSKEDLNPDVGLVSAGVVEIIKLQGEGWAYIKP